MGALAVGLVTFFVEIYQIAAKLYIFSYINTIADTVTRVQVLCKILRRLSPEVALLNKCFFLLTKKSVEA